jgi:patatin-like phospholipase/acyl hydrolase
MMADSDSKYLILSFDGGGIRGLITAMILQEINNLFPDFLSRANLFAGTSTGSFIALGLTDGVTPDELYTLYSTQGQNIFQVYSEFDTYQYVEYYNTGVYQALTDTLANPTNTLYQLSQTNPKQSVLVTSFQLYNSTTQTWVPLALHNLPNSDSAEHTTLIDAAMSSSAAQTYFQPYNHPYYGFCVDGGTVSNNPATLALSMAVDPKLANIPLENVWLLSIGTGTTLDSIPPATVEKIGPMNYGIENWMWPEQIGPTPKIPLMAAMFDGVSDIDSYQCQQFMGDRFQRADVQLPTPYALDDWQHVSQLEGYVNSYLGKDGSTPSQNWTDAKNWISSNF